MINSNGKRPKGILLSALLCLGSMNVLADERKIDLKEPLSLVVTYDSLLKNALYGQYAHQVTDTLALNGIGEYGVNQYRINGTADYRFHPQGWLKMGGEYLTQALPFRFDSGEARQSVHQTAYGIRAYHRGHRGLLHRMNMGGYWAKAPDLGLAKALFLRDGFGYSDARFLAGAIAQGLDVGGRLVIAPMVGLDTTLHYDSIHYARYVGVNNTPSQKGLGAGLKLNTAVNDRTKFSVEISSRLLYDTYRVEWNHLPLFASIQTTGLKISTFAQRLVSGNNAPSSNTYGLGFRFSGDVAGQSPQTFRWVDDPAVYMQRVIVDPQQKDTVVLG